MASLFFRHPRQFGFSTCDYRCMQSSGCKTVFVSSLISCTLSVIDSVGWFITASPPRNNRLSLPTHNDKKSNHSDTGICLAIPTRYNTALFFTLRSLGSSSSPLSSSDFSLDADAQLASSLSCSGYNHHHRKKKGKKTASFETIACFATV